MSRPAVLLGAAAAADSPVGSAALFAWLRDATPLATGKPNPRPIPLPAAPPGALVVVCGLAPWCGEEVGRLLARRRDLAAVAVLGRTPATDWPEYLDAAEGAALERLMPACEAVVVADEAAVGRLRLAMPDGPAPRLLIDHTIPSSLAGAASERADGELPAYVVAAGPSEARANTLLLLQLWRDALARGVAMPKLVLLGGRGTQVEEVAPLLDWNAALRRSVAEAPSLAAPHHAALVAGARALLAPDFCAPDVPLMRDAATLGVPVLAADTPEARALGLATRLSPLDGPGWRAAILAATAGPPIQRAVALPDWPALLQRLGGAWPP